MGLIQENRAEKALEALKKMAAPLAKVERDGVIKEIPGNQVVPGDLVILESGNFVPADMRLLEASNLEIEESALTGETLPVSKEANIITKESAQIGDMFNMAFATTTVTKGHARGVVCDTGMNTKVGKIAKIILDDKAPETPLQKRLRRSWEKTWNGSFNYLLLYFSNWNIKEDSVGSNVYDISWTCSCSNSRRLASYSNYIAFNRCNKDGKKELYN